jgi:hypothetical protein
MVGTVADHAALPKVARSGLLVTRDIEFGARYWL